MSIPKEKEAYFHKIILNLIRVSEDFKLIFNYYGVRSRDVDGKAPTGLWKLFGQYENLNLVEWLNAELGILDFSLKNKIRPIVNDAGFIF
jgi:hypothetical protein